MANTWNITPGAYRGLPMRCAPGTHDAVAELLRRHRPDVGHAALLDVASGSGALLARLRDQGWTDLHAIELDAGKFGFDGARPLAVDLNQPFARALGRQFRVVTAVEIIEHVDSPMHLLRELRGALLDGGHLVISTPNVANWVGRAKFLRRGELRYFDAAQYRYNHHLWPIPDVQMRNLLSEVGFAVVAATTAGTFMGPLKRAVLAPVAWAFAAVGGRAALGGDVNIYLCRKADPRPSVPVDWTTGPGERSEKH